MPIPKILVHIIDKRSALHQDILDCMARAATLNPDWEHRIYEDAEAEAFVRQHYPPRYLEALARIDRAYGPARGDLLRYLVMAKTGGVYLDAKSGFSKPLSQILRPEDEFVISQWDVGPGRTIETMPEHPELREVPDSEYQNWVIMTAPGHPFLLAVIEQVLRNIESYSRKSFGAGKNGVLRVTGPIAYTLAIHPLLGTAPARMVKCKAAGLVYMAAPLDHRLLQDKPHYSVFRHDVVRPAPDAPLWRRLAFWWRYAVYNLTTKIRHKNQRRLLRRKMAIEAERRRGLA